MTEVSGASEAPDTHFLVVDDDEDSRAMVVEYLKSMGHSRISQARDGAEGMRILERDATINFVISDWDMPQMNGLSLLQKVRAHPSRSHIPFVIMTSPISQESEKVILAAESMVDSYLVKPFRGEVLRQRVDQVLKLAIHGPQKTAVVVDDDPDAQAMIVEYLSKFGFKDVKAFPDGRAALGWLQANFAQAGLIISDWEMPQMSGLELLQSCKKNPDLNEIPFLMITSQSSIERTKVIQAAKSNVDQYLLKPFDAGEIRRKIEALMGASRTRQEVRQLTADAQRHLEHTQLPQAVTYFENALKLDPQADAALRGMGDALLKMKGVESALPYYKRAVEANDLNPRNHLKLGMAYEQIGWLDKAITLLQEAIRRISFSADLHFYLGRLYNKKGLTPFAKAEFEKTLEIQLDHQEARLMLEMINGRQNRQ